MYKNEKIEIDSWFLNGTTNQTIESVSLILKEAEIGVSIKEYYGRPAIFASSGVVVDFHEEENEQGIKALLGVRYWSKAIT